MLCPDNIQSGNEFFYNSKFTMVFQTKKILQYKMEKYNRSKVTPGFRKLRFKIRKQSSFKGKNNPQLGFEQK